MPVQEFVDFLGKHPPFDRLDGADLQRLSRHVQVGFYPAGASVVGPDTGPLDHLAVIRTGIVHVLDRGLVVDELGPGDTVGQFSLLSGLPPTQVAKAAVDTLLYVLPDPRTILAEPEMLRFSNGRTLGRSSLLASTVVDSTLRPVADYMRPPLWCDSQATIREAAHLMTEECASCVLVRLGHDIGIMTDSDCRKQVATGDFSIHSPVSSIASSPALTIPHDATAAAAFVTMVHRGVHHLLVVDTATGEPVGVCRAIDLAAAEIRDPLTIRSAIESADDEEALAQAASQLLPTIVTLYDAGVPPLRIGALHSAMVEALLEKCIGRVAPFASDESESYSWLLLGSFARREPLPTSDLDTALMWVGPSDPERGATLREAAEQVITTFEACGLERCPDGANASNPLFNRSYDEWLSRARLWRERPDTEGALLLSAMQADSWAVTGVVRSRQLGRDIRDLPNDDSFVRRSLVEALAHRPPVGFVKDFIVDHEGVHRGQLDLKRGGLNPIVGIGRWMALHTRSPISSTQERIKVGLEAGLLSADEAAQLAYAHEQVYELLFERQVASVRAGEPVSTWIDPKGVDSLRRRHLRQSFKAISHVQERLEAEWTTRL
jgi:CBS domain-containing protein